jgi:hypothetical protein
MKIFLYEINLLFSFNYNRFKFSDMNISNRKLTALIKFKIYLIFFTFNFVSVTAQVKSDIFWLDLCKPVDASISSNSSRNRLETNWRNTMSFGLVNCNHFKYEYRINSIPFASFVDTSYGDFSSSIRTSIDFSNENIFKFQLTGTEAIKQKYELLLDSLNVLESLYKRYKLIRSSFEERDDFFDSEMRPHLKGKDKINYENCLDTIEIYLINITYVEAELFEMLAISTQKPALSAMSEKLNDLVHRRDPIPYMDGLLNNLENGIIQLPGQFSDSTNYYLYSNYKGTLTRKYANQMLTIYQQIAQILRACLARIEIKYGENIEKYIANECNVIDSASVRRINEITREFNDIKELHFGLQELYILNPIQSTYFEKYMVYESEYIEFLKNKLTSLGRVISIDTIYIMPLSSNMKNYDIYSVDIDKIDRATNDKSSYKYDITAVQNV